MPKINSQGQKLGGPSSGGSSDARSAAARAAEVRTLPIWDTFSCRWDIERLDSMLTRFEGASQSNSAKGQIRQGSSQRKGADQDWDVGEY